MSKPLYSARIGDSYCLATGVAYEGLLDRIMEFIIRAAVARSAEESDWEHEELRRGGLQAIQIYRDGKAVWTDPDAFEKELVEARREGIERRFCALNELDSLLCHQIDSDLQDRWTDAGYRTPSLQFDMKRLFLELQRDATDRAHDARHGLLDDIMSRKHGR